MLNLDHLEALEKDATAAPWYSHIEIQDGRSEYDPSLEWLEISPYEDDGSDGFMFSEASGAVSDGQVANFDLTCALRNAAPAPLTTARHYDTLLAAVGAVVNCTSVDAENVALRELTKVWEAQTGTAAASGQGYVKHAPPPDQTDVINAALIGNEG